MDHSLVKRLRQEVGSRLADQRRLDAASGIAAMSPEDERQFARALIGQVLEVTERSTGAPLAYHSGNYHRLDGGSRLG